VSWFDWYVPLILGGVFLILGVVGILWGNYEESSYYDAIADRPDVREFLEHLPWRPEPHALKVGGRILIAVGLFCVIFAIVWIFV